MQRIALLLLLCSTASLTASFAPRRPATFAEASVTTSTTTTLFASSSHDVDDSKKTNKNDNSFRTAVTSFAVASTILSNVALSAGALPANAAAAQPSAGFAADSSLVLLAARTGGRMGGRAPVSRGSSYYSPRSRTRVYSSRTYVRPYRSPPVIVAPGHSFGFGYSPGFGYRYAPTYPLYGSPFGGGGYYYGNPFGGFGLGYGLGATLGSQTGRAVQEYRQDSKLEQVKAELQAEKIKAGTMEERIKQLEQQEGVAVGEEQEQQIQQGQPQLQQQ